MKVTIDTNELRAAVSTVIRAMSARTTMSILEGIYISAYGNDICLRCTDLSLQIETSVVGTVEEEGSAVLPGRLFSDVARKLPGDMTVIEADIKSAKVTSGRFKNELSCQNPDDFHTMAHINTDFTVILKRDMIKRMINQCAFAVSPDDSRPALTGVYTAVEGGMIKMVALDGYRLALRQEVVTENVPERDYSAVIPGKSLSELIKVLDDSDEKVNVSFSRTHVMFDTGVTKLTTRLIEDEFIKYKAILPEKHETRVRVNTQELAGSVERASLMAREAKSNLVKLSIKDNIIVITANCDTCNSEEEIETEQIGAGLDIAFNARYLSDVLKTVGDEFIYMDFINNVSPCVIRPVQGDEYLFLVLPVRLYAGM